MFRFLLSLMLMVSVCAYSQNGGQYPENNNIKLVYQGKVGTNYFTKVINKKGCPVTVKIEYNNVFTDVIIPANGFYSYNMGGIILDGVRAKTIQVNCGAPDNGWIECSLTAMPLKFTRVWFERNEYDKNQGILCFQIAEVSNVKHMIVRAYIDPKTKIQLNLYWPNTLQPNTTYQCVVNDIRALAKRLQDQGK
jgi:hypothetical protein